VTSLEPPVLFEAPSFVVDFQRDTSVLELLRVRGILEPAAAAMAAEVITDEQVQELRELLDRLGPRPDVDALVANDLEFHRRISACSGNSALCSLLGSLSGPATRARLCRSVVQRGGTERRLAEHRAILDALISRDPDVARSWATVHVASVEHDWLASLL
jgi:DNA-binding FadR family transcriptional regulator